MNDFLTAEGAEGAEEEKSVPYGFALSEWIGQMFSWLTE
jgi:hypothetical protein